MKYKFYIASNKQRESSLPEFFISSSVDIYMIRIDGVGVKFKDMVDFMKEKFTSLKINNTDYGYWYNVSKLELQEKYGVSVDEGFFEIEF